MAEKTFLITIGDRSVTGLVCRDQMVGPWQIPVADVAVTASSFDSYQGEAMAIGERAPIALLDHAASARMAVAESLTNIAAADIGSLNRIKLSANWMSAAGHPGEDAGLYAAVKAVGEELCPALGLTIPVGKDSMSMKTKWQQGETDKSVTSPLSLVITAFGAVRDVRNTLTPQLRTDLGESLLLLIDLGNGQNRLGGSCVAQVFNQLGKDVPDVDSPLILKRYFQAIQSLVSKQLIIAYHDRSDGGLFTTLAEMAFAGHTGIDICLDDVAAKSLVNDPASMLFSEELGCVIQIKKLDLNSVIAELEQYGLTSLCTVIGVPNTTDTIDIRLNNQSIISEKRGFYRQIWAETTDQMQRLRDNPACVDQEWQSKSNDQDPGLHSQLSFDINQDVAAPYIVKGLKPKMAILREQGVNSQSEMAAAFDRAGFAAIDVHMSDLLSQRVALDDFAGLVACGGFSYGDVLGAGEGWAKSILFNQYARDQLGEFFVRDSTFALGVCNGCQMLSNLKSLIPGADKWPHFVTNQSERFEARVAMLEVQSSPSIFFQGMQGSRMPIAVSHGEGRAEFIDLNAAVASTNVALQYVDNFGKVTEQYPANPNGSPFGITGLTNNDGRVTIMMPHPERVFRAVSNSWSDDSWQEDSPWMRMFRNARAFAG